MGAHRLQLQSREFGRGIGIQTAAEVSRLSGSCGEVEERQDLCDGVPLSRHRRIPPVAITLIQFLEIGNYECVLGSEAAVQTRLGNPRLAQNLVYPH
ncbi:Uncharacterised protein [Mycobacteroides abscessus subsp. abscessus]|nr:Uncharacterised protein [Mycobacteroides abscessus subsp. abscessus]SKV34383.1 Uncharacterised protein [Mycobacteroides abscessus subsp. abscessus]